MIAPPHEPPMFVPDPYFDDEKTEGFHHKLEPKLPNTEFPYSGLPNEKEINLCTTTADLKEWMLQLGMKQPNKQLKEPMQKALIEKIQEHCNQFCIDNPTLGYPGYPWANGVHVKGFSKKKNWKNNKKKEKTEHEKLTSHDKSNTQEDKVEENENNEDVSNETPHHENASE